MYRTGSEEVQCQHRGPEGIYGLIEKPKQRSGARYGVSKGSHEVGGCREDTSVWFSWKSMIRNVLSFSMYYFNMLFDTFALFQATLYGLGKIKCMATVKLLLAL